MLFFKRIVFLHDQMSLKLFFLILSYQNHLRFHSTKSSGGSVEFMCDRGDCGKSFKKPFPLVRHLKIHDNLYENCYFCPWRGNPFDSEWISSHLNQHLGQALFECSHCDKKFYRKDLLSKHFEVIHEKIEGRYTCRTCGFKTHSGDSFSKHKSKYGHF